MSCRLWLLGLVAVAASAACSNGANEDEASFDYGRDEMKAAIEGTWEGTSTTDDPGATGAPATLTLAYSTPEVHTLCSNRVLANGDALPGAVSPRCVDMSSINVTGTLISRPAAGAPTDSLVRGTFIVWSLRFADHGDLQADVDGAQLTATLSNGVLEGKLQGKDDAPSSFTLRRR